MKEFMRFCDGFLMYTDFFSLLTASPFSKNVIFFEFFLDSNLDLNVEILQV
jgi:hypothetical protein